jgi:peptidyl-prolyl cis-trans isomerase D
MAVIGSIRKRGTLLLVVVGLTMLAFILTDLLSGIGNNQKNVVLSFGKTEVTDQEFFSYLEFLKAEQATINNTDDFSEQALLDMSNSALAYFREKVVMIPEMEKAGIFVSTEEEKALFAGDIVHPYIRQMFTDPNTGQFSPDRVLEYDKQFATPLEEIPQENLAGFVQAQTQWSMIQRYVVQEHRMNKFQTLVVKSTYVTQAEAKSQFAQSSSMVNVQYVMVPFTTISDSTIQVDEKELAVYFKENAWKYRSAPYRQLQYVNFVAIPSAQDSTVLFNELAEVRQSFIDSDQDTAFIYQYTKDQPQVPTYVKKGTLNAVLDSMLFNAASGTVVGPMVQNGRFIMSKKLAEKDEPDSVFTYHILLQPQQEEEVQPKRQLRDSLLRALKSGANFFDVQAQFNEDEAAKADSGKVGWVTRTSQMDAMYIDSSFVCTTGGYQGATSQFGFHIIYRTKSTRPIRQMLYGEIYREILPGKETLDQAYNKASEFALAQEVSSDAREYMRSSRMQGFPVRDEYVTLESRGLRTVKGSNEVSRWALDAEVNTLSQVFSVERGFLVAVVTGDYGYEPTLEGVRELVTRDFIRSQKHVQLGEKMTSAMAAGSIDQAAAALGESVRSTQNLTWNGFLDQAGSEPLVIAQMFGAKNGQLIGPIEGYAASFIIQVSAKTPAPEMPDYTQNKQMLIQQAQAGIGQTLTSALLRNYQFKDFRYRFE